MNKDTESQIDFDHLNQYVGGDAGLTLEIFGLFQNQVDIWMKSLSIEADDAIWAGATHSLKGSARAVGAMKLAKICENAETLIGNNNRPGAREVAIDEIESRIGLVSIEIQRWEYRHNMRKLRGEV